MDSDSVDVLVIGSGIAGATAAITAAEAGSRVALACAGGFLSGSSFYPGTWGLGLVGPADADDADDLASTILEIGQNAADPVLVRAFVEGIPDAIRWLEEDLGAVLKRPASEQSARQAAFIPCFDHKHRMWRGITREPLERAIAAAFDRLGMRVIDRTELVDLEQRGDGRVAGALLYDRGADALLRVRAGAVVLAAGGTSGLFARRLTSADVMGSVHGIALAHGCALVNIEFMQMMPGLVSPRAGLVFNEKTFRYLRPLDACPRLDALGTGELTRLLEQRSGHGPFTARLEDRLVDLAIDEAGPRGLRARYDFPPREKRDEFVQEFAAWLEGEHGISPDDEFRIAMYAHASNGGIRIDAGARTGVPGLFACGEATGGMHGADRIGGLSSANGLVFGRIAGYGAAKAAAGNAREVAGTEGLDASRDGIDPELGRETLEELRACMSARAMINRTDEGLLSALDVINGLRKRIGAAAEPRREAAEIAALARITAQLDLAAAMVGAMRGRTASAGSHYRADAERPWRTA